MSYAVSGQCKASSFTLGALKDLAWFPPSLYIISGELAWSAQQNNYYQYLSVEFPERQNVTKIATQGKQNTREYVTEYILQYSDNADVWITFRDYSGHAKVDGEKHIF